MNEAENHQFLKWTILTLTCCHLTIYPIMICGASTYSKRFLEVFYPDVDGVGFIPEVSQAASKLLAHPVTRSRQNISHLTVTE